MFLKGFNLVFHSEYKELKENSDFLEKLMQNSSKKWNFFNSDFKGTRGAYYAEYGKWKYTVKFPGQSRNTPAHLKRLNCVHTPTIDVRTCPLRVIMYRKTFNNAKKALLLRVSMRGHVGDIKSGGVNTIRTLLMGRGIATLTSCVLLFIRRTHFQSFFHISEKQ